MSIDHDRTATPDVTDTARGLWQALSRRDFDAIKTFLSDDCIYFDMPFGPTLAARGPDDVVKRFKVAVEKLAEYENHDGPLLSNGVDVLFEHSETWKWVSGETALVQFVTAHKVRDGKVSLWKDYWDLGALIAQAPPTWMEDFASADVSWVFDATGLI
jgi:limonene-1,2-epoxide hydrolase